MPKRTKADLRRILKQKLPDTIEKVNQALSGMGLEPLESILSRIGRGQQLPHWYTDLKAQHTLPNLDGKTIGSVMEMLLVAVLEAYTFADLSLPPFRINPARGVDLPDLDLGIKSPSENYCTSEPFFSAYERLIGSEYDVLVLLTDYQEAKKHPPLRLQVIKYKYLRGSQLADRNLCRVALKHREWLVQTDESRAKRVFRFLAYLNQSDWRAKRLLALLDNIRDDAQVRSIINNSVKEFEKSNLKRTNTDKLPIPDSELDALRAILAVSPLHIGIVDAVDNWVTEVCKDTARSANDHEWQRLLSGPLDGMIGMSLALQWRYNFGYLFGVSTAIGEDDG